MSSSLVAVRAGEMSPYTVAYKPQEFLEETSTLKSGCLTYAADNFRLSQYEVESDFRFKYRVELGI